MDLGAFGSRKGTLTAFLIVPVLIVLGCALPAFYYLKRLDRDCEQRSRLLQVVADRDTLMEEGHASLKPLVEASPVPADLAAELTQQANEMGRKSGFAIQSVTVEEQPPIGPGVVVCALIRVQGAGTLPQLLRFLDAFESQVRRFKVVDLKFKASTLHPVVYDATCAILAAQFKAPSVAVSADSSPLGDPVPALKTAGDRLAHSIAALKAMQASRPALSIEDSKVAAVVVEETARATAELGELKLYGIIQKPGNPMALTDQGVKGIGEAVDGGGKIEAIGNESVTVVDGKGQRHVVKLYAEGGR